MALYSIIIPLYNKEDYIERAIDSVLSQTYLNFNIIVVDDGSKDSGANIVITKYKNDSRVTLLSKKNGGESSARNFGIEYAKSKYVCFLDADDEWEPNFLHEINRMVCLFPFASVYATNRKIIRSPLSHSVECSIFRNSKSENDIIINDIYDFMYRGSSPLSSSSICVLREAICSVGMFPVGIKLGPDILTWLRLFENYKIAFTYNSCVIIHQEAEGRVCNVNANLIGERDFSKYLSKQLLAFPTQFDRSKRRLISKHLVDEAALAIRRGETRLARRIMSDPRIIMCGYKPIFVFLLSFLPKMIVKCISKIKKVRV